MRVLRRSCVSGRLVWGWLAVCALLAISPRVASADTLNLGFVSYDVFIPGDEMAPGVNALNIFNLTGDFALDPDFPSLTPVTFLDSSLTLVVDDSPEVIALGSIAPGFLDPTGSLLFPETTALSFLMFSATLSTTTLPLGDGTVFIVDSPLLTLTLLPVIEPGFIAGLDFGVLSVEGRTESVPVPEPGTFVLLTSGILAAIGRSRRAEGLRDAATCGANRRLGARNP